MTSHKTPCWETEFLHALGDGWQLLLNGIFLHLHARAMRPASGQRFPYRRQPSHALGFLLPLLHKLFVRNAGNPFTAGVCVVQVLKMRLPLAYLMAKKST
jgi:hypothetical protein